MIYSVEDNEDTRRLILLILQSAGFEAQGFEDGDAFWAAMAKQTPELILLDVMLPGEDGMGLLTRLKTQPDVMRVPVIMLSAKGTEYDKVAGLSAGADDYLAKPFGAMELIARVKAVLRRAAPPPEEKTLRLGGIALDPTGHRVLAGGEEVALTFKEFELLRHLMEHPGRVYQREQLLSALWGMEYFGGTRTVDVHIQTLRKKLGPWGDQVKTIYGVGYKMEAGDE